MSQVRLAKSGRIVLDSVQLFFLAVKQPFLCFKKQIMKKTILVLEDDHIIGEVFTRVIDLLGYEPVISKSILHVHDVLKIHPDLIILDHNLGGGLGGILCHHLKATQSTKHLSIIVVSAAVGPAETVEKFGANEWIQKPLNIVDLQVKIAKLLSN